MDVFDLQGTLTLDTSDFEKSINSSIKAVEQVKAALNAGNRQMSEMDRLYDETVKQIDEASGETKTFKNELEKQNKALEEAENATSAFDNATSDLKKELDRTEKEAKELEQQYNETERETNELEHDTEKLGNTANETKGKFAGLVDFFKNGFIVGVKTAVASVVAAGAALTGVIKEVSNIAEYGDNIDKMSQKLNMTAEAYQEWDFIMQHCGATIDGMQAGMKMLATAAETGSEAFEKLGISQEQIATMTEEQLFSTTIKALQNVESETERTYIASKLFGKGATELGALLNTSAEDVEAMRQSVHDLGGVMSDEAVKNAATFQDSLQDMKTSIAGITRGAFSDLMPALTSVMDAVTVIFSGGDGVNKLTQGINDFITGVTQKIPKLIETGKTVAKAIFKGVTESIPALFESGGTLLKDITSGLESVAELTKEKLPSFIQTLGNALVSGSKILLESAVTIVTTLADAILNSSDSFFAVISDMIKMLGDFLVDALPVLIPKAFELVYGLIEALSRSDIFSQLTLVIVPILTAIAEGLINAAPIVYDKIPKIIENIFDMVTTHVNEHGVEWFEQLEKLAVTLINGVYDLTPKLLKALGSVFKTMFEGITEYMESIIDAAKIWGSDLITNFVNGITANIHMVTDAVSGIASTVKDYIGFSEPDKGALSNFHTFSPDMLDLFVKGIDENESKVFDRIQKLTDGISIRMQTPDINNYDSFTRSTAPAENTKEVIFNASFSFAGANFNTDKDGVEEWTDSAIEKIAERLEYMDIFGVRARGGTATV